mmetsp:Transcript_3959/g.7640  ORF Transcript_3959/g.7640 Transcript_3959/m.7640 type:complete len:108 (+) Transcript_3959:1692-2015(+)
MVTSNKGRPANQLFRMSAPSLEIPPKCSACYNSMEIERAKWSNWCTCMASFAHGRRCSPADKRAQQAHDLAIVEFSNSCAEGNKSNVFDLQCLQTTAIVKVFDLSRV